MKPKHAMAGVNPETLIVDQVGGWVIDSIFLAAGDGLMPIRVTWAEIENLLFKQLTEAEFLNLGLDCQGDIN